MSQEALRGLTRGALSFFSGTFLSRITGLVRDVSMAYVFGSHPALAAFMVAFRLSNLFRRLLGEGPLPSGFIPHFEAIRKESPRAGALFFRDLFFSLLGVLLLVLCFCEFVLFLCMKSSFFTASAQDICHLMFLMMPGILFICLYGISSALLQCERKFFFPSSAPLFFNVVWVASVFFLHNSLPEEAVVYLSYAVVFGFFLQWFCLVPLMGRSLKKWISLRELFTFQLFSKEVRGVVKPFLLGVVGVAATQINSALDAVFARFASLEGPAYLWYAIRIEQLPIALFGVALSSALLPPLAKAISLGNQEEFKSLLQFSFKKSLAFMLPCTVALFVLGVSGVNLLYGRGDFSLMATQQTVYCLWGYGLGLLPSVFVLLMAPAFYAEKNFGVPMRASLGAVFCNIFFNALFVFVFNYGAFSIALATSLSAWFNFFFLAYKLKERDLFPKRFWRLFSQIGVCSLIAGGGAFMIGQSLAADKTLAVLLGEHVVLSRVFFTQALQFFVLSGAFVLLFLSYAWFFKIEEILQLFKIRGVPSKVL